MKTDYILAVPSIIVTDIQIKDIPTILSNRLLSYNKYGNLPGSYAGKGYTMTGGFNYGGGSLTPLLYAGNTTTLINSGSLQIVFIDNLKNAYSGSQLISDGNIQQLLSTTNATEKQNLVASMVNSKVSGLVGQIAIQSVPTNGCTTQPSYTGTIFTVGTPTTSNESWQSTSTGSACYWTCGLGKVLVGNNCVSENCVGTTPDGISSTANATSTAGGTWNYNITGGLCTFVCNTNYHTEDNSTCVSNTRSCAITNGSGSQTWTSSWGTCSIVSCNGGFYQSGNTCIAYVNGVCTSLPANALYYNSTTSYSLTNANNGTSLIANYNATPMNNTCQYSCASGYSWNGSSCVDQTSPTITNVTSSSSTCNTIRFSINGATDVIGLNSSPYSFDGGSTWQAINYKDYSGTSYTINANLIKVRDSVGNVYNYGSSINGTSSSCIVRGEQQYTTPGSYTWITPAGVTSVSVVCVGGGSAGSFGAHYGGGGGGLGYKNNISVTPGSGYTVVVGNGGINTSRNGTDSYFINITTVKGGGGYSSAGGTHVGDGGGNGGNGGNGYSSSPTVTNFATSGTPGTGGGGGGSGGNTGDARSSGGGGVGIFGQGSSGGGSGPSNPPSGGGGGSSGGNGGISSPSGMSIGGLYGGGAFTYLNEGGGGGGACRIIWPGNTRLFPSTDTGL